MRYLGIEVCKNCQDREVGCHGKCERYIKARDEYETLKKEIDRQKYENRDYLTYKIGRVMSTRRKK